MTSLMLTIAAMWLSPCSYEDSNYCYWDAQTMGNHRGHSFIAWGDEVYLIN